MESNSEIQPNDVVELATLALYEREAIESIEELKLIVLRYVACDLET